MATTNQPTGQTLKPSPEVIKDHIELIDGAMDIIRQHGAEGVEGVVQAREGLHYFDMALKEVANAKHRQAFFDMGCRLCNQLITQKSVSSFGIASIEVVEH
jgi:hypothetical protein